MLENFKDENEKFFCNLTGDKRVRSMLSLLRASKISFPRKSDARGEGVHKGISKSRGEGHGDVTDVDQSLLRDVNSKHIFHAL